jgi:hypothetical protein
MLRIMHDSADGPENRPERGAAKKQQHNESLPSPSHEIFLLSESSRATRSRGRKESI